mgnify:CR=1 FL=1
MVRPHSTEEPKSFLDLFLNSTLQLVIRGNSFDYDDITVASEER